MNKKLLWGIGLLLLLLFGLFWFVTNPKKHFDNKETLVKDTWEGKEIVFPSGLRLLEGRNVLPFEKADSKIKDRKKVISIIDANCAKCIIGQLNKIDRLFDELTSKNNMAMIFLLNIQPEDSANFMLTLQPEIKAKGLLLWDDDYLFETENKLFTPQAGRRTFMVDKNNRILKVGNPLFEPKLLEEYRKKLQTLTKKTKKRS